MVSSPLIFVKNLTTNFSQMSSSISEGASLVISKEPYKTIFSLGDSFENDGLEISLVDKSQNITIEDFVISGHNPYSLGTQVISISYQDLEVEYSIDVTNKDALFFPLVSVDLMFTEYVQLGNNSFALEIFNGSPNTISIEDYILSVGDDEYVFNSHDLLVNEVIVISASTSNEDIKKKANQVIEGLSWNSGEEISLRKDEKLIDVISTSESDRGENCINGACSLFNNTLRRDEKSTITNPTFSKQNWYSLDNDISNLGVFSFHTPNLTYEQQAKAYGEYVMYGAGMFAAGRVEEAYNQLKKEYENMNVNSKAFFVQNPNYEIEGIDEQGKLDKSTFREASGRIGVLASRLGQPSFLPKMASSFSTDTSALKNIISMLLIGLVFTGFFGAIKYKKFIH